MEEIMASVRILDEDGYEIENEFLGIDANESVKDIEEQVTSHYDIPKNGSFIVEFNYEAKETSHVQEHYEQIREKNKLQKKYDEIKKQKTKKRTVTIQW